MNCCPPFPVFVAVRTVGLIVLVVNIESAAAQSRMDRTPYGFELVNTVTYTSPSGAYSLQVNSNDQLGLGRYGAAYRFSCKGKQVWGEYRPYTLRQVIVTDNGTVVGFAYRTEPQATGGRLYLREYFHVVIIDGRGTQILNDVTERLPLPITSSPPTPRRPYAQQLLVDRHNDRIVVRVAEPKSDVGTSPWWVYRLSTGETLERFDPRALVVDSHRVGWVSRVEVVRGTPLTLVHYVVLHRPLAAEQMGALFILIDLDGKPEWSLDLLDDYTALFAGKAERDLAPYLEEHPAIVRSHARKRFEIRSFAKNERIGFRVDQDDTASWVVSEVSRIEYKEPAG